MGAVSPTTTTPYEKGKLITSVYFSIKEKRNTSISQLMWYTHTFRTSGYWKVLYSWQLKCNTSLWFLLASWESNGLDDTEDLNTNKTLSSFKLIYFNWRLTTLQYCGGFCHTLTWISHGCTCIPHLEPLIPPSSPFHPSGSSQCTTLSTLYHTLKLDGWSFSHMIIYMFQCYSLKSSHPRLLPQSPTIWSLYLCLFCFPAYRVIHF